MQGVQSGMVGMAIFDMWYAAVKKAHKHHHAEGSPLVAAVAEAFEAYLHTKEIEHSAQIAGVAAYVLNPGGGSVKPLSQQQMAPFLALNVMA